MKDLEERNDFFQAAAEHTPFLATSTRSGAMFVLRTDDRHVSRTLFAKRQRGDMAAIQRAIAALGELVGRNASSGKTFIDVGANIGTSVVYALVTHEFSDGVAIEPEPANFRTLQLNRTLNDLDERLTCLEVAASDQPGSVDFVIEHGRSGKHWVASEGRAEDVEGKKRHLVQVPTVSLDSLGQMGVFDVDRVGLVWIDAQAHEAHILAGASALLDRGTPVAFEWDPASLDRTGSRSNLEDIVTANYTHFVDLRTNPDPDKPPFELRPSSSFPEFAERFLAPAEKGRGFTDVLVLNPAPERIAKADLMAMTRKSDSSDGG